MSRKEGFCDSCQQNKDHRRVAGVFSLINLFLLGVPSLFGISTWACTHCRSVRIFLFRQREVRQEIRSSSFHKTAQPSPNGALKPQAPRKRKSTRSQLYSEKYRDAVARRVVSGITSIAEVKQSLELSDSDVLDWLKQSFQRKEDRVEMLREALISYQKDRPEFNVEEAMLDITSNQMAEQNSPKVQSQPIDDSPLQTDKWQFS